MPIGPLGWTCQMHREHECKFVLMVQVLASAEVDFVAWIGPKLLRHIEGFASFCPHLLLLLPGGEFGGGGVWKLRGLGELALGRGRGRVFYRVQVFGWVVVLSVMFVCQYITV